MDTLDRFGRKYTRDAAVERRTHGINIGPGTHVAVVGILFDRSKTVLQDDRYALVLSVRGTCRTEIKELGLARRCDRNVVRADIPVDKSLCMNLRKGLHDRHQDVDGSLIGDPSAVLVQIVFKAFTVNIFHNEICSIVLFEEILD